MQPLSSSAELPRTVSPRLKRKRRQTSTRQRGAWNRLLPWLKFECLEDRSLLASDFGDAPDLGLGTAANNYNTLLADNGPRKINARPAKSPPHQPPRQ